MKNKKIQFLIFVLKMCPFHIILLRQWNKAEYILHEQRTLYKHRYYFIINCAYLTQEK